jgi:hypothetical protein
MEIAVALQYPNGRRCETVLTSAQVPVRGMEFEMYGHTWRAIGLRDFKHVDRLRRKVDPAAESTRVLCVCVD